ncbi:MAG: hypothetical protein RL563_1098 [Pseudomonadota bacterium]|jgi:hypothetical protein
MQAADMHTSFHADTMGETFVVQNQQDVEPIIEHCKMLNDTGAVGGSEMRHAASFPMVLVESYCNQHGITFADWLKDKEHIKRMLRDPDLKGFRIWQGRV